MRLLQPLQGSDQDQDQDEKHEQQKNKQSVSGQPYGSFHVPSLSYLMPAAPSGSSSAGSNRQEWRPIPCARLSLISRCTDCRSSEAAGLRPPVFSADSASHSS